MARVTKNKTLLLILATMLISTYGLRAQEASPETLSEKPSLVLVPPPIPDNNPFDAIQSGDDSLPSETDTEAVADDSFSIIEEEFDGSLPSTLFDVPIIELPTDTLRPSKRTMRIGRFTLLHKVTAKIRPLDLRLDEPVEIDDLRITMHDCVSTPPEEPPETKAFLTILEVKGEEESRLFNGWMFASSPGINALEHAVYDLWPTACVGTDDLPFTGE